MSIDTRALAEAFVGSLGIFLAGFMTLPLAGFVAGVHVSMGQGAVMGLVLGVLRTIWFYVLRITWKKLEG